MNETGKEVYQISEGDWAFACCGIISDGFATKKEAELAAEVERLREGKKPEPDFYPDTEADGVVFCGKCGKMK